MAFARGDTVLYRGSVRGTPGQYPAKVTHASAEGYIIEVQFNGDVIVKDEVPQSRLELPGQEQKEQKEQKEPQEQQNQQELQEQQPGPPSQQKLAAPATPSRKGGGLQRLWNKRGGNKDETASAVLQAPSPPVIKSVTPRDGSCDVHIAASRDLVVEYTVTASPGGAVGKVKCGKENKPATVAVKGLQNGTGCVQFIPTRCVVVLGTVENAD